jgi:hypothetical protein
MHISFRDSPYLPRFCGEGFDENGEKEGTFPRILHVQQNSLRTFSLCTKILYAHSPFPPKMENTLIGEKRAKTGNSVNNCPT